MNINAFLNSLPIVAEGMLGIFLVIFVIFAITCIVNKLFK